MDNQTTEHGTDTLKAKQDDAQLQPIDHNRLGQFQKGNTAAAAVKRDRSVSPATLRKAMRDSVSTHDIRRIMRALVRKAAAGNVDAAREVLDRVYGKSKQVIDLADDARQPEIVLIRQINQILERQPDLRELVSPEPMPEPEPEPKHTQGPALPGGENVLPLPV